MTECGAARRPLMCERSGERRATLRGTFLCTQSSKYGQFGTSKVLIFGALLNRQEALTLLDGRRGILLPQNEEIKVVSTQQDKWHLDLLAAAELCGNLNLNKQFEFCGQRIAIYVKRQL